ncbi:hypothetical protein LIER_25835 [Lithospermum erythrorhizon]|uniref:Helitron helicase-like domain-containing protein n=1 Tax=Lithospermum erythrorhizon TaxID=34254 RepID=A0AAV3RA96_LITER
MLNDEERRQRKRSYYATNKDVINKIRHLTSSVESKREEINRKRLERFAGDRSLILPRVSACAYYGAYRFYRESANFCCSSGQVSLASFVLPDYLVSLVTGSDDTSKDFQAMIRTYNNHFAYSMMSIHYDPEYGRRNRGIYTVRAQGPIYRFLNDLFMADSSYPMAGLFFYFYDPIEQLANRTSALPRLRATTIAALVILMEPNPYSLFLRTLSTVENMERHYIIIKTDSTLDQRVYNAPSSLEVASIWVEDDDGATGRSHEHNIQVYTRNIPTVGSVLVDPSPEIASSSSTVDHSHSSSFGAVVNAYNMFKKHYKQGCHVEGVSMVRTNHRSTVSCRQYYAYKLHQRPGDTSYLLRFGRLLQQYVVDMYIKIELMRLSYFKNNQDKLRVEYYKGVADSVLSGV